MTEPSIRHVGGGVPEPSLTLKEAVVEAIARRAHGRLTGAGELGSVIMDDSPSRRLAAGMILPSSRRVNAEGGGGLAGDATSPIHVSSLGLSFQVARDVPGEIVVRPRGAVYVRVLPTAADIAAIGGIGFGLAKDARREMRQLKGQLLEQFCAEAGIPMRRVAPEQRATLNDCRKRAAEESWERLARGRGLSRAVTVAANSDARLVGEEAPIVAEAADDRQRREADEADVRLNEALAAADGVPAEEAEGEVDDSSTRSWNVRPGMPAAELPPDGLVERAEIPAKWLRLDVTWPEFAFDPSASRTDIRQAFQGHARVLHEALSTRLVAWLEDDDPFHGGRLWAFPRATSPSNPVHKVGPSQVREWDATLEAIRARRDRAALPSEDFDLRVEASVVDDPLDGSRRTVRISLTNRSRLVDTSTVPDKLMDRGLFLAGIDVGMPGDLHRDHVLNRVEPSYRWNGRLQHAGIGINCGCEKVPADPLGPDVVVLRSTHLPSWRQPRIVPHALQPPPRFDTLAASDGGIPVIQALVSDYESWLEETANSEPWRIADAAHGGPELEARERARFEEDVAAWRKELARIRIGLAVLTESRTAFERSGASEEAAMPFVAWQATNATFARIANAGGPTSWRLFQVAFLVAHLPGVCSRIPAWSRRPDLFLPDADGADPMAVDDATATLLYFPTGGGKSEAFFGLLVLQCFVDRLRGKRRGVTGLVRYPLRLLTAQQANRFARTLAMAELERRSRQIGGDPFQIGFWVGSGNTPNHEGADGFRDLPEWDEAKLTRAAEAELREGKSYRRALKWRRLTECPFCRGQDVALRRRHEEVAQRLVHACVDPSCPWNGAHGRVEPLPFHVMDTDIYAYAPTVLLGTVDRMAMIAFNPLTMARIFGMLGLAPWIVEYRDAQGAPLPGHGRLVHPRRPGQGGSRKWFDPAQHRCRTIGPIYRNAVIELFDPLPAIEIQDEAHLLEQSLGTFSGLFGTMLETALHDLAPLLASALRSKLVDGRPRRAKVVAASATVEGPERQIEMLYQRQVVMFPRPGPTLYESFFARLQGSEDLDVGRSEIPDEEIATPTRRLYLSMPTNGRPHTSGTVAVLSALHLTLTEAYRGICSPEREARTLVRHRLADALPAGPLLGFHRHALEAATDDQLAEAVDLARIVLSYVTNKKGGDSVQAALGEFVPRDHERAGVALGETQGVRTGLITGSVEMEDIQAIVERAKEQWQPGTEADLERDFLKQLRSIVATSAISHGVDVERLNLMVFAGLPSDVAEYVQASSRVGRTHVGVSILVPTPQRPRDVHVVGIHDVFHRFLERMVQPAAIDRWGENAIMRVLSSALQLKVSVVDHFARLVHETGDRAPEACWASDGVPAMRDRLRSPDRSGEIDELVGFLARCIGLVDDDLLRSRYLPGAHEWYRSQLRASVTRLLVDMTSETWRSSRFDTFFEGTRRPSPMTSLRDVDEPGSIVSADRSGSNGRPLRRGKVASIMKLLRRGDGKWSEQERDEETA